MASFTSPIWHVSPLPSLISGLRCVLTGRRKTEGRRSQERCYRLSAAARHKAGCRKEAEPRTRNEREKIANTRKTCVKGNQCET